MKLHDIFNVHWIAQQFMFYGGGGKDGGGSSAPAATPPAPTLDTTAAQGDIAAQQMAQALQRGRTATMVTGGQGVKNMGTTSSTLLGN